MKETELRQHLDCSICHKKIGHTRLPLFWVMQIERYVLNLNNIQQQDGLTALVGGHAGLAHILGPDRDMATKLLEKTLTVCETCAMEMHVVALALEEHA